MTLATGQTAAYKFSVTAGQRVVVSFSPLAITPAGGLLSATGNSYASFLLGALNSATVNEDSKVLTFAQFSGYSWWAADDFKVSPRLTLNLGLRHDIMLPYTEAGDNFTYLDINAPNPAAGQTSAGAA